MHVIHNDASRSERVDTPLFTGEVYRKPLVGQTESDQLTVGAVEFVSGGRNVLHTHSYDQVLYVTEGEGIVATATEEHVIRTGDVAVIPAGEPHWHGANTNTSMTHLAIGRPGKTEIV